jgi:hypothetical protein
MYAPFARKSRRALPFRSLESRVERLEAIAALLVRHIRGTDVMSDEELERIERDL